MGIFRRKVRIFGWEDSKFIRDIREKVGLPNLFSGTKEQWDEFYKSSSEKKVLHWLTSRLPMILEDIFFFVPNLWYSFCTANVWKVIRNLWVFRKSIKEYRSWDYYGMLLFMETAARDMSELHKNHGHLKRSDETSKELLVFAELLKRIREDDYTEDKLDFDPSKGFKNSFSQKENTLPSYRNPSVFYDKLKKQQDNDVELAAEMFRRKVRCWWE